MRSILRSSTYRLALLYMGMFGLSVCALLAFIYWSTAGYMARQTDATIESEITGLAERYRLGNLDGLVHSINERIRRNPFGSSIYLLTDANFDRVVGNLDRWPNVAPGEDGWLEFELSAGPGPNDRHRARARRFRLSRGFYLLVGRDMSERIATEALIVKAMISGLAFTILLGIAGGVMMSRSTLRRIDAINSTSREIMDGDLGRRIPTRGTDDDFDRLAANLNGMLDQIEQLMDGVRQVSNNIAHDLRTPLTRLRNRLESLSLKLEDEDVEQALSEADGLLATFNALLRIARIEGGARRSGFSQVALDQVLADVLELYEPLAHDKEQQVRAHLQADITISGDRDLLFQAFANLIDNAIKYTPHGGSIGISLQLLNDCKQVRITDSGPGIPEAERKRVFERFVRLEESRTLPGNGLGLSLVAAVAKLHSAVIRLADANPGLDVFFEFPVHSG
ncbi:MAG: HAMP domain-containing histidine kinase, partial [Gammaproteobacteria bacterium]|nr:HAMP domain-containing histidine kinase [Gammaproteobacteria bacterium]